MKIPNKYRKHAELYKRIASDWDCDFSEEALYEFFIKESLGKGDFNQQDGIFLCDKKLNGYAVGKRWLDITVAMWKEDIQNGWIKEYGWYNFLKELYRDFPDNHKWLDNVWSKFIKEKKAIYESYGIPFDDSYRQP